MHLAIFNGSPRGHGSNTRILLKKFRIGFLQTPGNTRELAYLNNVPAHAALLDKFKTADAVLIGFPLYSDAMPGIVKAFIETMGTRRNLCVNKKILFIVHCGLMESYNCQAVEKYLKKLCIRLGAEYTGSMLRGGSEGIQGMPSWMTRKLYACLQQLGVHFGRTGTLDPVLIQKLARPVRLNFLQRILFRALRLLRLTDYYWDVKLRQNQGYTKIFDRPYA